MTLKKQTKIVDEFNANNPVGTPVRYWTFLREGEGKQSKTRSEAQLMFDHAVVWVEGHAGCIDLTHVQTIEATPTAKEARP